MANATLRHDMTLVKPRVLISDFHTADISAELPYLFSEAGCTVDVYCAENSWLRKNSYVTVWHPTQHASASLYARGLLEVTREIKYDWVVLADDAALWAVNETLDGEDALALLPVTTAAHRKLLGSKLALSLACKQNNIPTPAFCTALHTPCFENLSVPFPLLLKVDRSNAGRGVFLCKNAAQCQEIMEALSVEERKDLLIQEFVPGTDIAVEALFRKGVLLAYAASRVLENMSGAFSVSSLRKYGPHPEVEPLLKRLGHTLGTDGFCNITLREEAGTKALFVIEADARPNLWFAQTRFAGLSFSRAIKGYLSGETVTSPLKASEATLRHFYRDLNRSIETQDYVNIFLWLCNEGGRWKFIPSYDYKLLFAIASLLVSTRKQALAARYPWLLAFKKAITPTPTNASGSF